MGFGAHIQIGNLDAARSYETRPVVVGDSMMAALSDYPEVKHVQRYSTKPGMIKTADAFQGMVLKGVGQEYDSTFFHRHLLEGEFPQFSDSASSNRVVISKSLANKLQLKLGDKIDTYFIQDDVRARRMKIVGIYQTNFSEYDNLFLLTDLYLVNRLNNWEPDSVKLRLLCERADALGAEYIATGHYARAEGGALYMGRPENDQSYMLCRILPDQLRRLLLPLGGMAKTETRELAASLGLPAAQKPDSMELCFVPDGDYAAWLEQRGDAPGPGDIIYNGAAVASHGGIHRFTLGQRRGLGYAAGKRVYVSEIRLPLAPIS